MQGEKPRPQRQLGRGVFIPSTFVEQCQKAGFTPSGAMMLYDELRRFAFHSVDLEVKAPPGHLLVRVRTADQTAYMVTLKSQPKPAPSKKAAGPR